MAFTAKWPGDCMDCDDRIHPGEQVEFDDSRHLRHVLCPESRDRDGHPKPVCPRCFLVMVRDGTGQGWMCGYCDD